MAPSSHAGSLITWRDGGGVGGHSDHSQQRKYSEKLIMILTGIIMWRLQSSWITCLSGQANVAAIRGDPKTPPPPFIHQAHHPTSSTHIFLIDAKPITHSYWSPHCCVAKKPWDRLFFSHSRLNKTELQIWTASFHVSPYQSHGSRGWLPDKGATHSQLNFWSIF